MSSGAGWPAAGRRIGLDSKSRQSWDGGGCLVNFNFYGEQRMDIPSKKEKPDFSGRLMRWSEAWPVFSAAEKVTGRREAPCGCSAEGGWKRRAPLPDADTGELPADYRFVPNERLVWADGYAAESDHGGVMDRDGAGRLPFSWQAGQATDGVLSARGASCALPETGRPSVRAEAEPADDCGARRYRGAGESRPDVTCPNTKAAGGRAAAAWERVGGTQPSASVSSMSESKKFAAGVAGSPSQRTSDCGERTLYWAADERRKTESECKDAGLMTYQAVFFTKKDVVYERIGVKSDNKDGDTSSGNAVVPAMCCIVTLSDRISDCDGVTMGQLDAGVVSASMCGDIGFGSAGQAADGVTGRHGCPGPTGVCRYRIRMACLMKAQAHTAEKQCESQETQMKPTISGG